MKPQILYFVTSKPWIFTPEMDNTSGKSIIMWQLLAYDKKYYWVKMTQHVHFWNTFKYHHWDTMSMQTCIRLQILCATYTLHLLVFMKIQALPIFDLLLIYFTSVVDFLKAFIIHSIAWNLRLQSKGWENNDRWNPTYKIKDKTIGWVNHLFADTKGIIHLNM